MAEKNLKISSMEVWFSSNVVKINLLSKIMFNQESSSIKEYLLSKIIFHFRFLSQHVVFHLRLSSIKGHLPSKAVYKKRSFSIVGVLHQSQSSILSHLQSRFIVHQRLSSRSLYHSGQIQFEFLCILRLLSFLSRLHF